MLRICMIAREHAGVCMCIPATTAMGCCCSISALTSTCMGWPAQRLCVHLWDCACSTSNGFCFPRCSRALQCCMIGACIGLENSREFLLPRWCRDSGAFVAFETDVGLFAATVLWVCHRKLGDFPNFEVAVFEIPLYLATERHLRRRCR